MVQRLLALAIVLLLPVPALADTNTLKFSCKYPNYADKEGVHRVKGDFTLTFIIDLDTGTAYMLGKTGRTQVQVALEPDSRSWAEGVTFIEFTPSGHVRTTTAVDRGYSVHTRTMLIAGEWVSIQYYGTCVGVVRYKAPE